MKWESLQKGDIIDLVAPGFLPSRKDFDESVAALKKWGFTPRFDKKILGKNLICSNSTEERFRQLKSALQAQDSKAIWFVRGGYGSLHLLEPLKKIKPPRKPKLLIGLSDITSLHIFFNQNWKWPTLHGPLLYYLASKTSAKSALNETRRIVSGKQKAVIFDHLRPLNGPASRSTQIKSTVTGGNLAVATSQIGGPFQLQSKGKILFFEEIGERAYRVDRMLTQWQMAGAFNGVKAVIFGQFLGGEDPDGKDRTQQLLKQFAQSVSFPVFKGLASGHGRVQRPLPLNTPAVLTTGRHARLVCESGNI